MSDVTTAFGFFDDRDITGEGRAKCDYPGCGERAKSCCEHCDRHFCPDHGTRGGDRETEGGLVAYPATCWNCGGFNADA